MKAQAITQGDQGKYPHWIVLDGKNISHRDLERRIARALSLADKAASAEQKTEDCGARTTIGELLAEAVKQGTLTVRNPLDKSPMDSPIGLELDDAVVIPEDLRSFLADHRIGLLIGGAGPIDWTIESAIADWGTEIVWDLNTRNALTQAMVGAAQCGELVSRDPRTGMENDGARKVRADFDYVHRCDVNAWLEGQETEWRWGELRQARPRNLVGWYDISLNAFRWWRYASVSPSDAALLLCELDPNKTTAEDARKMASSETCADDFIDMLRTFEGVALCDPKVRSLAEWRLTAIREGLKYHSWIDQYAQAMSLTAPETQAVLMEADVREAPGRVKGMPWWRTSYDILEMAKEIGAKLHSQQKRYSNAAISKEIESRINNIERSKGRDRNSPSWDTIRAVLTRWKFRPE